MSIVTGIIIAIGMIVLVLMAVPLPWALGFMSVVGIAFGMGLPALAKVGWTPFSVLHNMLWTPLPLFVLMGCIITETGIGSDVFKAASNWLSRIPGGLVVATIWAEAVMAAAIGSSTATIVAVGNAAMPQMVKLGYDRGFSASALICGGVLGPLIPPSAMMIVYSIFSEQSLGKLLIAGIVPGILLACMFSTYTIVACVMNPKLSPISIKVSWREKITSVRRVWPIAVVMISLLGGIYMGIVTPTEAAGVAVVVIMIIGFLFFSLRGTNLKRAITETALVNAMMMLVMVIATVFAYVIGSGGIGKKLVSIIASSSISPWAVMIVINIVILFLGCIMDGITITVVTLPLLIPLIAGLGFDLIWFGVVFVVNMETGLITPPFAMNLFMAKTMYKIPTAELIHHVTPFLVVLIIFLVLIIAFPQISLWLPSHMIM